MADDKTKIEQQAEQGPVHADSAAGNPPQKRKNSKRMRRKSASNVARREAEKQRRMHSAGRKKQDAVQAPAQPASVPEQKEKEPDKAGTTVQTVPLDVMNTEDVPECHNVDADAENIPQPVSSEMNPEPLQEEKTDVSQQEPQQLLLEEQSSSEQQAKPQEEAKCEEEDAPVEEEKPAGELDLKPEKESEQTVPETQPASEDAMPNIEMQAAEKEEPLAQQAAEESKKANKRAARQGKRHCFTFYVAVTTGVVVLASVVSIFVMFFSTGNPLFTVSQDVELPNFYNMTKEEIESNPDYSGFHIEFVDVYSDEVAEGHVVDQSPKPPKEVKENASITLRISRGIEKVEVPDMVGWTRASASEKVKSINLSILIKYETDESKPYNTVLRTSPKAGTTLEAGDTLTVYVNREELAVGWITAPSCVGLSQSEAGRLLTSRGLSYSFIKVDSDSPEGCVVSQSPSAGDGIAQGGSVTLRVSNGLGASGDGVIHDPNVADGSVTGHHHSWIAWQDGHWICAVCGAVK